MKRRAFTLAEIMIVLTIIGVLAGILVPIATQNRPDENVMKFKKAHTTLGNVIKALVTSDKYFKNGDLGQKSDGSGLNYNDENGSYFCYAMADIMSAKKVECYNSTFPATNTGFRLLSNESILDIETGNKLRRTVTNETIAATKTYFDNECKKRGPTYGKEIITPDGIVYYQAGATQFGAYRTSYLRFFSNPNEFPANYGDQKGFDISYKVYCIDVDGVPASATSTNCVNECPFGYGIRADGKILPGTRAEEWLVKSIQGDN